MALDLNYRPTVLVDTSGMSEAEWLSWRRMGIGGSDVSAVFNDSPWNTAVDIYYDKLGIAPAQNEECQNWVQLEVGHLLEPLVAKIFYKKTGYMPMRVPKMFQHPFYPWMLADIDYIVQFMDKKTGRMLTYVLECKTTHPDNIKSWGTDYNPKIPLYYEYQGRHYMSVLNADGVFFALFAGNTEGDFVLRVMSRDLEKEELIIQTEDTFWNRHVIPKVLPAYEGSPKLILRSKEKHYGHEISTPLTITNKADLKVCQEWINAKAEKEAAEKKVNELTKKVAEKQGKMLDVLKGHRNANFVLNGETYSTSYKHRETRRVPSDMIPTFEALYPDIFDEFVVSSRSEWLSVSKAKL